MPRFRHKIDARTSILNSALPDEYKVDEKYLFQIMYGSERFKLIGSDVLTLRIYHYFLQNHEIDFIDPYKLNTLKLRHDFINQFNHILDSKNQLTKYKMKNSLYTYKLEKQGRHKIIPGLVGVIYVTYGKQSAEKFVDDWVILGQWSSKGYTHKGLVELYTEKSLQLF